MIFPFAVTFNITDYKGKKQGWRGELTKSCAAGVDNITGLHRTKFGAYCPVTPPKMVMGITLCCTSLWHGELP